MVNKKVLWCAAVCLCGLVLMAAYSRPFRWWPVNDMTEQPAIKPFHTDGLRPPAEGSVAIDGWEPVPTKLELAQYPDFKNPVPRTPESIEKGKALYETYCWTCHGTGMSPDPTKWSPVPTMNAVSAKVNLIQIYSDEHIYSVITHGSAIMKRMSYHLDPEERWHVVNYVRTLIEAHQAETAGGN